LTALGIKHHRATGGVVIDRVAARGHVVVTERGVFEPELAIAAHNVNFSVNSFHGLNGTDCWRTH
jgi:hypothetical protein